MRLHLDGETRARDGLYILVRTKPSVITRIETQLMLLEIGMRRATVKQDNRDISPRLLTCMYVNDNIVTNL